MLHILLLDYIQLFSFKIMQSGLTPIEVHGVSSEFGRLVVLCLACRFKAVYQVTLLVLREVKLNLLILLKRLFLLFAHIIDSGFLLGW